MTITITQNDVRAIQLAKAALYAGVRLLMDKLNVDKIDRIRLAGAFGSHIDVKYAMVLGLIPDCAIENVTSAGNAAGSGAHIALVDSNARLEIEREVRRIEKIETAVESRFSRAFYRGNGYSAQNGSLSRAFESRVMARSFRIKRVGIVNRTPSKTPLMRSAGTLVLI